MRTNLQVIIHGQEINIPVDLNIEQLKKLYETAEAHKGMTGWEKPNSDDQCYYEDALGRVQSVIVDENSNTQIDMLFDKANCFISERVARDQARARNLLRRIRRFAVLNRKTSIDMLNNGGYTITYNFIDKCLEVGLTGNWAALGDVLFDTEDSARAAINEFSDDLIWYFTEAKDSV